MKTPTVLLVDNSNTRTKFMLSRGGILHPSQRILPTGAISPPAVRRLLHGWDYQRAVLCSVVPAKADILAESLGVPVCRLTRHARLNIRLDYPGVRTLGADRIANAMAAARNCPLPCVAVDLGTAVTFDVVVPGDELPRFIGGVIAPGLPSMTQYLSRNTAQLPAIEPEEPEHAIGRTTAEALHAGTVLGYRGLIREILNSIAAELACTPYVIATGGDAPLLASQLSEITELDPLLTFRGINLAGQLNP